MGSMSRTKGRRAEQELVLYLARRYWKAERILRQYQVAGQPDVIATKNGVTYTFEMKFYRDEFVKIYELYKSERLDNNSVRFVEFSRGTAVVMSTDFEEVLKPEGYFRDISLTEADPKKIRLFKKILKLKELKQSADFLVVRSNRQPMLFIRYFDGL